MTTETDLSARAQVMDGYDDIRHLRQGQDLEWVLAAAPADWQSVLDLGCGTGALLRVLLEARQGAAPVAAVGLDASAHRLVEARANLGPRADRVELVQADLASPPALRRRFDLITLTSVLHWLYPREDALLEWVAGTLTDRGGVLVTTHHPILDEDGFGAEDEIVREAVVDLGLADRAGFARLLAAHDVVPMGARARPVAAVERLLTGALRVEAVQERRPELRPADGAEHARFHLATFGDYFSRVAGPGGQAEFFAALARAAQARLDRGGPLYRIPVRLWRLAPRD